MTSVAEGAPRLAFPVPVAPMAPEPLVPDVSTPVKLITVIDQNFPVAPGFHPARVVVTVFPSVSCGTIRLRRTPRFS